MLRSLLVAGTLSLSITVCTVSAEPLSAVGQSVSYNVSGSTLAAVLNELHLRTGMEFILAEDLTKEPVTADIQGNSWREVVRSLLSGYNYVATGAQDGTWRSVRISSRAPDKADKTSGIVATAGL